MKTNKELSLNSISLVVIPALVFCCDWFNARHIELILSSSPELIFNTNCKHQESEEFDILIYNMTGKQIIKFLEDFYLKTDSSYSAILIKDRIHIEWNEHS